VLGKEDEIVEQYLYRPYPRPYPPREQWLSSESNKAGSPDFKRSFLAERGYYVFTLPKTQTFDLLIHVPLSVIQKADRMEVKIVAE
jgi:hypothetical protein